MDEQVAQKYGDNKQFIVILYKESLTFESKNSIISKNLNQLNNCWSHSLERKDLVRKKSL